MKKTRSRKKPISADSIARLADNGKDVSRFFTNSGKMMKPGAPRVAVTRGVLLLLLLL